MTNSSQQILGFSTIASSPTEYSASLSIQSSAKHVSISKLSNKLSSSMAVILHEISTSFISFSKTPTFSSTPSSSKVSTPQFIITPTFPPTSVLTTKTLFPSENVVLTSSSTGFFFTQVQTTFISSDIILFSEASVIPTPTSQLLPSSQFSFSTSLLSQALTTVVPSTTQPFVFFTTFILSQTSAIPSPTSRHLPSSHFESFLFSQALTSFTPSTTEPFMFITTLISSDTSVIPSPTSKHLYSSHFESFSSSFSFSTSVLSQALTSVVPSTTKPIFFVTTSISSKISDIPTPTSQILSSSRFESFNSSFSYTTSLFSQALTSFTPSTTEPFMFMTTLISSDTSVIPSPTSQQLPTSFTSFTPFSFNTPLVSQESTTIMPSTTEPSMFISTLTLSETLTIRIPTSQLLSSSQFESFVPSFPFSTFSQALTTILHSTTNRFMFFTTQIFPSDSSAIPIPTSQLLSSSQFESLTPSFSYTTSLFSQELTVVPSTSEPSMFISTSEPSDITIPTGQLISSSQFESFNPFSYTTSLFSQTLTIVATSTTESFMFITTLISSDTSVIPTPTSQQLPTSFASFTPFSFNTPLVSQESTTIMPSTTEPSMFISTLTLSETLTIRIPTSQLLSSSQFESFVPSFPFSTFSQALTTILHSTTNRFMFFTTQIFSSDSSAIPIPTSQFLSSSQFESLTPSFSYTTSLFSQELTVVPSTSEPSMFISTSEPSDITIPTGQLISSSQFESFNPFSYTTSLFSQTLTIVATSTTESFMFITTLISSDTSVIPTPTSQQLPTSFASFTPFSFNTPLVSQESTTIMPSTTEPSMFISTLTLSETLTIRIPTSQLLSSSQFESFVPSFPFSTFSQALTTILHSTTNRFMFFTTQIFSSDSSAIPIPTSQLLSSSQFESLTPSFSYTTSLFSQELTVVPSISEPSMFISTSEPSDITTSTGQLISSSQFESFNPFSYTTSLFSQTLTIVATSTTESFMFITTLISSDTSVIPTPTSQHLSTSFASSTSQRSTIIMPSITKPLILITTLTLSETSTIPTSQHLSSSQFESFTPFPFSTLLFSQAMTTILHSITNPMFFTTHIFSSDFSTIPISTTQLLSSTQFESFSPSFSYTTSLFSQKLTIVVPSTSKSFMFISTLIPSETLAIPTSTSQPSSSSQFESYIPSLSFSTSLFSQALTTLVPSTSEPFMFITTHTFSKTTAMSSTSMATSFVATTPLQMMSTLKSDILLLNSTLILSETPMTSIVPSQTSLLTPTLTELEVSLPNTSPLPTPTPTNGESHMPPEIVPSNLQVGLRRRINVSCFSTGLPIRRVIWLHNNDSKLFSHMKYVIYMNLCWYT